MQKPSTILSQFKQYPSLQLNSNTKFIKTIYKESFDKPDIIWVATEKIHGSNFSIVYDFSCNRVKYARRNDFLTDEIPIPVNDVQPFFKQNFFDIHENVQGFHNDLQKIKINVLKKYQNIQGIQIYGQYFGGFWPQGNCKRRIQPGVYYTAQHQFMVFDIRLIGEEFHTWAQVTQIPAIVEDVLKYVPIYAKGTFQQLQKVKTEFDSTIPTLLGLKHIKDNICEGLVIRPNKNLFSRNRVILKKKNKEFLEKVGLKKDPKAHKVDKEGMKEHKEVLQAFINDNRIQSAISKHPDFQDQYHLKGHVVQDVLSDAQKQGYKLPEDPKLLKEVKKFLDVMTFVKVTDYLKKQRPQFADRIKG